jgi:hypothetical protein
MSIRRAVFSCCRGGRREPLGRGDCQRNGCSILANSRPRRPRPEAAGKARLTFRRQKKLFSAVPAENLESSESSGGSTGRSVMSRACSHSFRLLLARLPDSPRAELELELIALHHQVAVLNRQRPGRLRLGFVDRLVWAPLFMVWPRCLENANPGVVRRSLIPWSSRKVTGVIARNVLRSGGNLRWKAAVQSSSKMSNLRISQRIGLELDIRKSGIGGVHQGWHCRYSGT